jgi:ATP-binding cassette, subfamily B (MDR/TAP), member 1
MPIRKYDNCAPFQNDEPSTSPKMSKSPSLQRAHGYSNHLDTQHVSPKGQNAADHVSEAPPSLKRQDSLETKLPNLPKIDVRPTNPMNRQFSNTSDQDPESPVSPLLTSDSERSHSKNFTLNHFYDFKSKTKKTKTKTKPPSFWRLAELSLAEWPYALLGSLGAAIFGSFNPLLAYTTGLIVAAYYRIDVNDIRHEVNRWCLLIACMGVLTVVANFLQHFYFGIMGEKMTERVRRMMFSGTYLHPNFFLVWNHWI